MITQNHSSIDLADSSAAPVSGATASRPRHSPGNPPADSNWTPPSWKVRLMGFIFMPRMLAKGRRLLASREQGRDLMNGFLFGDFDYADGKLLKFLRSRESRVIELLRKFDDDQDVARALIAESGRSAAEIETWNRRFQTINALFLAMWEADEGRRKPGFTTSLLKQSYNYGLMPPVYLIFGIAQKLRQWRKRRNPAAVTV